jgi:hypothetical protein
LVVQGGEFGLSSEQIEEIMDRENGLALLSSSREEAEETQVAPASEKVQKGELGLSSEEIDEIMLKGEEEEGPRRHVRIDQA